MREVSLLKSLAQYPNFVQLLDVIEEGDSDKNRIHCIFEFCDQDLCKKLQKKTQLLKPQEAMDIIKQILEAINLLHKKLILHRDIKPENILIMKNGKLKLADFGLAKKATFL